ncbi:spore maturation protein [Mucisphaera calidilacus]|uniref:Spore maturation protein B n=1 Tax=Mucisphaera calidilacus TaxID=2527982 RepID=A0A518BWH7_9BACT|nr:nucleoside recognition domain-containing protein [Mucisphaera calidilacus]QDU71328.1 Spore maturation protein B [Mucisphaera calidilacus]
MMELFDTLTAPLKEYGGDFGTLVVMGMLVGFPLIGILRGVNVYEEFVTGAKEGFNVAVMIIPYLVAIIFAVKMLQASGGLEMIANTLAPTLVYLGVPTQPELLAMFIVRPLTGGGSAGILAGMAETYGPEHVATKIAGVVFGSTETTFYIIAVYFGAVGIKKIRHAALVGILADISAIILAIIFVQLLNT